jgi:signal transduction histidine kinase
MQQPGLASRQTNSSTSLLLYQQAKFKWSVGRKIGLGYAIALGTALLGTAIGVVAGDYYQQEAWEQREHAQREVDLLHRLESSLLQIQHHQEKLLPLPETVNQFKAEYDHIVDHIQEIDEVWIEAKRLVPIEQRVDKLDPETFSGIVNTYPDRVWLYLEHLQRIVEWIKLSQLKSPEDRNLAQKRLLEFTKSPVATQLETLTRDLENTIQAAEMGMVETSRASYAANHLRAQIIFASLLLSVIVATILAFYTSREIARPLRKVNQVAQRITAESNFDLRVPVLTQDEVGALAQSLNQLIQRVHELLQEQRAATEQQLIQSEKMASLGQMLAGVAHEINNPVNFIYGNLSHANQYIDELFDLIRTYEKLTPSCVELEVKKEEIDLEFLEQDLPKLLQSMRVGADRTRQIVLSLRNFSRLDESSMHSVNLHECLDNTLLILNHRIKKGIQVERCYGDIPAIEGYAGPLHQVFMNLLSNAIDALESGVDISEATGLAGLRNIERRQKTEDRRLFGEAHASQKTEVVESGVIWIETKVVDGDQVMVGIRDNGPGIAPENLQRIFDRFFTTKPMGVGTGLGLSITHQIVVEKHGGQLTCRSQLGEGTTFSVILPVHQTAKMMTVEEKLVPVGCG